MRVVNTQQTFFISLILHALLLAMGMVSIQFFKPSVILGNKINQFVEIVPEYKRPLVKKLKMQTKNLIDKDSIALSKKIIKQPAIPKKILKPFKQKGEQIKNLLAILHQAIEAHQTYPLIAEEMGQEGRVTVAFTLLRNGQAKNIRVGRSSGIASLDEAALLAVSSASPFKGIGSYLSKTGIYSVDVVFELA